MLPAVIFLSALLVWRHKTNILNLVAGRERRIGEKTQAEPSPAPESEQT
jgi:hypothetical protein